MANIQINENHPSMLPEDIGNAVASVIEILSMTGMTAQEIANRLLDGSSDVQIDLIRDIVDEQIVNSEIVSAAAAGYITFMEYSQLESNGAPASGELAMVWNDPVASNNGYYGWTGSEWVKSKFRKKEAIPNGPCFKDIDGEINGFVAETTGDGTWTIRVRGSYMLDGIRYSVGLPGDHVIIPCAEGDKYIIATESGISCVASLPADMHAVLAYLGPYWWAHSVPHYGVSAKKLTGLPGNTSTLYPMAVWNGQGFNDVSADHQKYQITHMPHVDRPDCQAAIHHLKNDLVKPADTHPKWLVLDGLMNAFHPPFSAPVPRVKTSGLPSYDDKFQYNVAQFAYEKTTDPGFDGKLKSDQTIVITGLLDRAIDFNHMSSPDGIDINSMSQDAGFPPEIEIYRAGSIKGATRLRAFNENTIVTFSASGNDQLDGKYWQLKKVSRGSNESYMSGVSIPAGGSMIKSFLPGRSNTTGTVSVKFNSGHTAPVVDILDASDVVIASSSTVVDNVVQVAYNNSTNTTKIKVSDQSGTSVVSKIAHYYDRTDYTELYLFSEDESGFTLSGGASYVSATQPSAFNQTVTATISPLDERDLTLTLNGTEAAGKIAPVMNIIAEDIILERAFGGQDPSATLGTTMFNNGDTGVSFLLRRCITNSYRERLDGWLAGNWKFDSATNAPITYVIDGMDCSSIADNLPEGNGLTARNIYCAYSKMLQFMDGRGSHADLIQGFSGDSGGRENIFYFNLWLHQVPFESGENPWFDPLLYPDFDTENDTGSKAGPNSSLFFVKKDTPFFRNITMIKGLSYGGTYPLRLAKLANGAVYENIVVKDWFLFGNSHKYYSISANAANNDVVTSADLDIKEWDVRCAQTGLPLPSPALVADHQTEVGGYRTLQLVDICGHTDWDATLV